MLKASDIKILLNGRLVGDQQATANVICPVSASHADALTIILSAQDLKNLSTCKAGIIVGPKAIADIEAKAKIIIDRLDVITLNTLLRYYKAEKYRLKEQENISTMLGVYISRHATIGKDCHFMPGVRILNGAIIGNNVAIHSNTIIKEGTIIGDNVTIDSNNSIGNFSFEYMLNQAGEYERLESVGRVIIKDDVEIGSNNTIDRGTLGDTIIGRGTKIDNLVQIGHDCHIGRHCLIVSQSGIAGHTTLGNRVIVHGQCAIAGHLHIGDGSVIQGKSGVSRSCPPGSRLFGYPARDSKAYMKSLATLHGLSKGKPIKKSEPRAIRWLDKLRQVFSIGKASMS